jgi:hypothetical protein
MDHYIPKRRIPVTLWASAVQGVRAQLFLDLDPHGNRHQTVVEKLNESTRFLPVAVGDDGRIHLFNKARLVRVTVGRQVVQTDIFARGFQPWREEAADVLLADGVSLEGRVWTPLQRDTQRLSDFMNEQGGQFFVLLGASGVHLVNARLVVRMVLEESAGAPLVALPIEDGSPY